MARRGRAVPAHAQDADVRAHGGIVAAATTSLPEQLGGVRNWDYRFCWLRDATITLQSLMYSGYMEEARAWRHWLLRAIAGDPAELQIMYGVAGERRLDEYAEWLRGTKGIRCASGTPLRISSSWTCTARSWTPCTRRAKPGWNRTSGRGTCNGRSLLRGEKLEHPRRGHLGGAHSRHFLHSKLMAWVAADRAVKAVEQADLEGPVTRWRTTRRDPPRHHVQGL